MGRDRVERNETNINSEGDMKKMRYCLNRTWPECEKPVSVLPSVQPNNQTNGEYEKKKRNK